ncbi:MAG: hypothetical protein ACI319_06795 [Holdemanella porci]|uniref:hypothetical protein n=1 Tax=Holdemanella porci TaxID=2652276 RepID=UPI0022E35548|nr:hypothetical protein [Holdemanella porci]
MKQTTGMTLRELLKKLYVENITLQWDSDDYPIAKIYNLMENDWVLSEELLDSEVFGIEAHDNEIHILLRC